MKKIFAVSVLVIMILYANQAQAKVNVEQAATAIINAYKSKDVTLLKKYSSGVMVHAINKGFFESSEAKSLVLIAEKWDGIVKEIRYSRGEIMGKTILLANVYFSDNSNGSLDVVRLSSYENSDWKAFAFGISDISKSEFEEGSEKVPGEISVKKNKSAKNDRSEFSIEMASGDFYKKPTIGKLKELLKSLDADNFFLILNSKDGFLQASISEQGYIVQYSKGDGMFEAKDYFSMDMLADIFVTYIDKGEWKSKAKWIEM